MTDTTDRGGIGHGGSNPPVRKLTHTPEEIKTAFGYYEATRHTETRLSLQHSDVLYQTVIDLLGDDQSSG